MAEKAEKSGLFVICRKCHKWYWETHKTRTICPKCKAKRRRR